MSLALALGIGAGVAGLASGIYQGYKNYQAQSVNLDYQKAMQQQAWQREDTAIQRRRQDLLAAGLNPYAAINAGGAPTSAPVKTEAPQLAGLSQAFSTGIGASIDMLKSLEEIKQQKMYTRFLGLQNENQSLKNLDLGNWLDSEWLWKDSDDVYHRYDYTKSYGRGVFQNVLDSTLGFKRADYDSRSMDYDVLAQSYQNDLLKVHRDFAVADKIENYVMDGIDKFFDFKRITRPRGPKSSWKK